MVQLLCYHSQLPEATVSKAGHPLHQRNFWMTILHKCGTDIAPDVVNEVTLVAGVPP